MTSINELTHNYDMQIAVDAHLANHSLMYAEQCELAVGIETTNSCGGGIDTFGTLGSAGTFGGCFGCLGTAGCCC